LPRPGKPVKGCVGGWRKKKERVIKKNTEKRRERSCQGKPPNSLVNISHYTQDFDVISPRFQTLGQAPMST